MNDREEIIACYETMYDGMCRKDTQKLARVLDESYVLVHMTGSRMNRREYFTAIRNGTLNYYWYRHEAMDIQIDGNKARLTGDTQVEAAVYGGGKHTWPLRLDCQLIKKEGEWKMTKSVASTY